MLLGKYITIVLYSVDRIRDNVLVCNLRDSDVKFKQSVSFVQCAVINLYLPTYLINMSNI